MKKILTILFCALFCVSPILCNAQSKKQKAEKVNTTDLKPEEQVTYGVSITIYCPFELYINDILAKKNYRGGSTSSGVKANPFLLKSGTYKFKLVLLPLLSSKDGLLHPEDIVDNKLRLSWMNNAGDFKYIEDYGMPKLTQSVPYLEIEHEFTVELPYNLEGWSNSRVFAPKTAEDSAKLIKEVVAAYNTMRDMINDGEMEKFLGLWEKADKERLIYDYETRETRDKINSDWAKKMKKIITGNNMVPIEDYELKIYAQGRVLELVRKPTIEAYKYKVNIKGWSALIYDHGKGIQGLSGRLHWPKDGHSFEIIRK